MDTEWHETMKKGKVKSSWWGTLKMRWKGEMLRKWGGKVIIPPPHNLLDSTFLVVGGVQWNPSLDFIRSDYGLMALQSPVLSSANPAGYQQLSWPEARTFLTKWLAHKEVQLTLLSHEEVKTVMFVLFQLFLVTSSLTGKDSLIALQIPTAYWPKAQAGLSKAGPVLLSRDRHGSTINLAASPALGLVHLGPQLHLP